MTYSPDGMLMVKIAHLTRERDAALSKLAEAEKALAGVKKHESKLSRTLSSWQSRAVKAEARVAELEGSVQRLQSILANEEAVTTKLAAQTERAAVVAWLRSEYAVQAGFACTDDIADEVAAGAHLETPPAGTEGDDV